MLRRLNIDNKFWRTLVNVNDKKLILVDEFDRSL